MNSQELRKYMNLMEDTSREPLSPVYSLTSVDDDWYLYVFENKRDMVVFDMWWAQFEGSTETAAYMGVLDRTVSSAPKVPSGALSKYYGVSPEEGYDTEALADIVSICRKTSIELDPETRLPVGTKSEEEPNDVGDIEQKDV